MQNLKKKIEMRKGGKKKRAVISAHGTPLGSAEGRAEVRVFL
jgi:hypothetical protein